MADYSTLKAAVADVVKTNGSQAITGANLQSVLLAIINSIGGGGYIFAGVATPETSIGAPDQNVFYLVGAGTYANFGDSYTVNSGSIGVFRYNGSWSKSQISITDENTLIYLGYYDVSAHNSGASYASLSDALAAVPTSYRRGGMTVKYKDSVLGKYVQYRLTTLTWSATPSYWQGIDGLPTIGSRNLVESGGTYYNAMSRIADSVEVVKTDKAIALAGSDTAWIATEPIPVEEGALYKVYIDNTEQWIYNSSLLYSTAILYAYYFDNSDETFTLGNHVANIDALLYAESIPYTGETFLYVPTGYNINYVRLRACKTNDLSCRVVKVNDPYIDLLDGNNDPSGKRLANGDNLLQFLHNSADEYPFNEQSSNRMRLYFDNRKGYPVYINAGCYGYQLKITVTPTANMTTRNIQIGGGVTYTVNDSYAAAAEGFISEGYSGIIGIHVRKSNDGVFTAQDIANINARLVVDIYIDPANYKMELEPNEQEIHIGRNLLNKTIVKNGWGTDSSSRVSTHDLLAFPYNGSFTLRYHAPKCLAMGMRAGTDPRNLTNYFFLFDGGTAFSSDNYSVAPMGTNAIWYRFVWCAVAYANGGQSYSLVDMPAAEVTNLIDMGLLKVTYVSEGNDDILENNADTEKYVKAMMLDPDRDAATGRRGYTNFCIAHTSDIHGDVKRTENFMQYADYINADLALVSGDIVIYDNTNGADYLTEIDAKSKTPLAVCVGNHEINVNTADNIATTDALVYDILIEGLSEHEKNGWKFPSISNPTYFYQDFSAKKIRLISLNLYEGGQVRENGYSGTSMNCHPSQAQVNWFIQTLQNTPAGYGILVMLHTALADINTELTANDAFYTLPQYRVDWFVNNGWDGTKFIDLIDAFINRTTISTSYQQSLTYTGVSGTETININADFTGVDSSVEFIAWVSGHEHCDCIGYLQGAQNKQVQLNIACGTGVYVGTNYAAYSDLPRGGKGSVQDSFNVYSIDRKNKTIRIARVGSNTTFYNSDRKTMIIDYV